MEPLYYVMAILGCGDGEAACQQVRVEPTRYASAVQCQVAMTGVLQRNADLMYPTVAASCEKRGQQVVERSAKGARG